MVESQDVGARLADGRPAVDTIGEYVWACHLLGYQNPDLTVHSAQVRDWYSSEDGLDLRALDADRGALAAVAAAADDARTLQEQQLATLTDAWRGRGGEASREFLLRHGEASSAAASAVRSAVDVLTALRDDLWRAVDDKVSAAIEIDARRQAQRPEWQAATQTVTSGAGDRAVASETVDQQVKPFVESDIGGDWLTAMQKAMAAVSAAFDAATAALTGPPSPTFEVPGDLGSTPMSSWSTGSPPVVDTAGTAPAGWSPAPASTPTPAPAPAAAPPPVAPAPAFPAALAEPTASPPATAPASAMPSMPSLGEMGSAGLPSGSGGFDGLASALADAISGLLDGPDGELPEASDVDDTAIGDEEAVSEEGDDVEKADDAEKTDEDDQDEKAEDVAGTAESAVEPAEDCETEVPADEVPPTDPVPTPPPQPMPPPIAEPPPEAEPLGAETPCEIAADELPQAGPST